MTDITVEHLNALTEEIRRRVPGDHILRRMPDPRHYEIRTTEGAYLGWLDMEAADSLQAVYLVEDHPQERHPLADTIASLRQGDVVKAEFKSGSGLSSTHVGAVTIEDFQVSIWPGPLLRSEDGWITSCLTVLTIVERAS